MRPLNIAALATSIFLATGAYGSNPFLSATDDRPVSAQFSGAEWGDEIEQDEIALSARVVTTRLAKMSWGEIFKIEFTEINSRAKERRQITPEYFIVTGDRIVLLNEEDNDAAVKKIFAMEKPPPFEQGNIYGITQGAFSYEEGPWQTKIELKGEQCTYLSSHNSGHFKKVVWKKGVGLVEYSMGRGAMADGFRLKRATPKGH